MGSRKHIRAEQTREVKKTQFVAKLNNVPTSPRKMRIVADLVRGMDVDKALYVLQYTSKESAQRLYKLLLSAIANWKEKNEGARLEENQLYIKALGDGKGHISIEGEAIDAVGIGNRLNFSLEIDQTDLSYTIKQLKEMVKRYPVRSV